MVCLFFFHNFLKHFSWHETPNNLAEGFVGACVDTAGSCVHSLLSLAERHRTYASPVILLVLTLFWSAAVVILCEPFRSFIEALITQLNPPPCFITTFWLCQLDFNISYLIQFFLVTNQQQLHFRLPFFLLSWKSLYSF